MPQQTTFYLLLETSRAFTRNLFRGVIRWSNLYGPVTLVTAPGHVEQSLPKIRSTQNVGLIARLPTPGVLEVVKDLEVPIVTIEPSLPEFAAIKEELGISEIVSDAKAIGQLGVDHFTEHGFSRLAFCGLPSRIWSQAREEEFICHAESVGISALVYEYPVDGSILSREEERVWLTRWLHSLPKPIGIMACNDDRGAELLEICQFEGINVPEQIAILGVDNDDLLCELTTPALSSVTFDLGKAGFEAAALLWDLLKGNRSGYHQIVLSPTGIVTRRSTEVISIEDLVLQQAMRYIRENYLRPIGVAEVARDLDISRRTLERRFVDVLGRSVRDQIILLRFEKAQNLLLNTEDSIDEIARRSGFSHVKPMVRAFRSFCGMCPSEYRAQRK